jgi:L-seryl-tRNA(Ser) seleniumtransferase
MTAAFRKLPSVDRVLREPAIKALADNYGALVTRSIVRETLAGFREALQTRPREIGDDVFASVIREVAERSKSRASRRLAPVFNLTGTVLHTNLGRAVLPKEAVEAMIAVAREPATLEYDLEGGERGDRERDVEERILRLTGAEAVTLVNNNAAAVLLALNSLAFGKEVPVSRGELVEIGGSFRMPDIMGRAGCILVETGATNRTHPKDFENAINDRTALLMKVHSSNFVMTGFTAAVGEADMARIAHSRGLPLITDLGSGALIDLSDYGLPAEQTPMQALKNGADLVTFSGDKLLGGPQAGLIIGGGELVEKLKGNPLKRALRLDKVTLAALDAVLALYESPGSLAKRLPTLRHLTRSAGEIKAQAERLIGPVRAALSKGWTVRVLPCVSEVGSGAAPGAGIESFGLSLSPTGRGDGRRLDSLAGAFRLLPKPVVGKIHKGCLVFDLRCLEDESRFVEQLRHLSDEPGRPR